MAGLDGLDVERRRLAGWRWDEQVEILAAALTWEPGNGKTRLTAP